MKVVNALSLHPVGTQVSAARVRGWPRTFEGQIGLADVVGRIEATILIGFSSAGLTPPPRPGSSSRLGPIHREKQLRRCTTGLGPGRHWLPGRACHVRRDLITRQPLPKPLWLVTEVGCGSRHGHEEGLTGNRCEAVESVRKSRRQKRDRA